MGRKDGVTGSKAKRATAGSKTEKAGVERKPGPRRPDPPLLKAQKAAATRDAVRAIQACSGLPAAAIEELLGIGRDKQSKNNGKTGELLNSYLGATEKKDTARDETLARIMFRAIEHGLLDPQQMILMSMEPGIRRAILPVRSLLLKLAIRGETKASPEEAYEGYKRWFVALAQQEKDRQNERANLVSWKKKVLKGLDEFLIRLDSLQHYSWAVERDDRGVAYELCGRVTLSAGTTSEKSVHAINAKIDVAPEAPQLDLDTTAAQQLIRGVAEGFVAGRHDASDPIPPTLIEEVKVSSGESLSATQDFRQQIEAIKSRIMQIQIDPRYEVDGDLPHVKDSPEEEAELTRQLSLFLDRPALTPEEVEAWHEAQRSYREQIDAEVNMRSPRIDSAPALERSSRADPVLTFLESLPMDLPTVTLAQARAWTANRRTDPDEPKALIPP